MYQIWKRYVNENNFFLFIFIFSIIKNIIYNRKFVYQIFVWLYLTNEMFKKYS